MMRSSEPFHHFVDDYLAYLHEVHPTGATLDGIHTYDDHIEDFSRHAIEQHTRALSGFARRLQDINQNDLTPVEKAEQPMVAANIQARMFDLEQIRTWERSPQLYSDTLCSEPRGAGGVYACPAPRAGAARAVEAPPDRPPRAGGPRQHQGSAGHLRQGRSRDVPRRAQLHREGSAARVFRARRYAPARRSGRCLHGGRPDYFELHPIPRGRRGAQGARLVSAGARSLRAEAGARRGTHDGCRSPSQHCAAGIPGDAGGISIARWKARRRRSDCGLAQSEGRTSRARCACLRRRSSSSRSSARSSIAMGLSRGPKGSRLSWRRRPSSIDGRSRACGCRARSSRKRHAPTTT